MNDFIAHSKCTICVNYCEIVTDSWRLDKTSPGLQLPSYNEPVVEILPQIPVHGWKELTSVWSSAHPALGFVHSDMLLSSLQLWRVNLAFLSAPTRHSQQISLGYFFYFLVPFSAKATECYGKITGNQQFLESNQPVRVRDHTLKPFYMILFTWCHMFIWDHVQFLGITRF